MFYEYGLLAGKGGILGQAMQNAAKALEQGTEPPLLTIYQGHGLTISLTGKASMAYKDRLKIGVVMTKEDPAFSVETIYCVLNGQSWTDYPSWKPLYKKDGRISGYTSDIWVYVLPETLNSLADVHELLILPQISKGTYYSNEYS